MLTAKRKYKKANVVEIQYVIQGNSDYNCHPEAGRILCSRAVIVKILRSLLRQDDIVYLRWLFMKHQSSARCHQA